MDAWEAALELLSTLLFSVLLGWMLLYLLSVTSTFAHSDMRLVRRAAEQGDGKTRGEGHEGMEGRGGEGSTEGASDKPSPLLSQEKALGDDGGRGDAGGLKRAEEEREEKEEEGREEEEEEDWEGIEKSSELEERFNAAATWVASMAASATAPTSTPVPSSTTQPLAPGPSSAPCISASAAPALHKSTLPSSSSSSSSSSSTSSFAQLFGKAERPRASSAMGEGLQLMLYSLYKQATEGPCRTPSPSLVNFRAKTKWNAWRSLREMSNEDAMERYIELVGKMSPEFGEALAGQGKGEQGVAEGALGSSAAGAAAVGARGTGKAVSTFQLEEGEAAGAGTEGPLSRLLELAAGGCLAELEGLLGGADVSIDETDDEGRTALHWAADRGQEEAVTLLLEHGASIDAQDSEGQTPLHYAAICEHQGVAKILLQHGASTTVLDNEDTIAASLLPEGLLKT